MHIPLGLSPDGESLPLWLSEVIPIQALGSYVHRIIELEEVIQAIESNSLLRTGIKFQASLQMIGQPLLEHFQWWRAPYTVGSIVYLL